MRRSEQVISYLVLSLSTAFSAYTYMDKHGSEISFFAGAILIYLMYALSGLIYYSKENLSDSWHSIYTFSHRLVLTLAFTLYLADVLFASADIPKEATYALLLVASLIAIVAQNDGYVKYKYTDPLIIVNLLLFGYLCYTTNDKYFCLTELFAAAAYHVYRNSVSIMDRNPQHMSNYFHSGFLWAATYTVC